MNISRFFIDRLVFAGVLSVLIFVSGLLALGGLPISEYPEVVPPQVVVRANYPGASPKVVAETVATPIEEQINGVEGMIYMYSQATTDGLMTLTITFKLGTSPELAQQLVQNRVTQAELRLPDAVRALGITTIGAQNIQAAAGVIGASPNVSGLATQLSINAQGRLTSVEKFDDIVVHVGAGGAVTRLRDVARTELGANDYSLRSILDNKTAAAAVIFQAPGSNAIQTADNVRRVMEEVRQTMPEGVTYQIVYDTTQFVRASISAVVHTLLDAICSRLCLKRHNMAALDPPSARHDDRRVELPIHPIIVGAADAVVYPGHSRQGIDVGQADGLLHVLDRQGQSRRALPNHFLAADNVGERAGTLTGVP